MRRSCFGMIVSFMVVATMPVRAAEFRHEGWIGQAVVQDGKFRQCHMWSAAINNYDVGLSLEPNGELRLGLRSHQVDMFWSMVFNQKTAMRIQLDRGPVLTKAFTAVTPTLLSTSLNGTDWENRLKGAELLRINTGSKVRLFHLTGIKEAMGKLRACAAKHRTV